jgi:hypothetical protein
VCILVSFLAILSVSLLHADQPKKKRKPAKDMPTLMCERGKLLFSDDFSGEKLSEEWKVALGQWEIVDGALKGVELAKDDHAAVIRHPMEYKNLIAQFCVKFDGGKATSFSCNKTGVGHVCRVSINPTGFSVNKDRPTKESKEEAKVLDTVKVELKKGEWYTVLVEILDEEMVASVTTPDGRQTVTAFGEHSGVAQDKKTDFTFPVSGEAIYFDDVRVWEAQPTKKWKSTKKKLELQRKIQQAREAAKQQR